MPEPPTKQTTPSRFSISQARFDRELLNSCLSSQLRLKSFERFLDLQEAAETGFALVEREYAEVAEELALHYTDLLLQQQQQVILAQPFCIGVSTL